MINLCFGLPGTGKSTYVRSKPITRRLKLDVGHNSFKSEAARDKFYRKLHKTTTSIITCLESKTVYWDTYPEYFEISDILKFKNNINIIFAIPSEKGLRQIIERVGTRDGTDSELFKLYSKNGYKWRMEWVTIYNTWKSKFGKKRVKLIEKYDDL